MWKSFRDQQPLCGRYHLTLIRSVDLDAQYEFHDLFGGHLARFQKRLATGQPVEVEADVIGPAKLFRFQFLGPARRHLGLYHPVPAAKIGRAISAQRQTVENAQEFRVRGHFFDQVDMGSEPSTRRLMFSRCFQISNTVITTISAVSSLNPTMKATVVVSTAETIADSEEMR